MRTLSHSHMHTDANAFVYLIGVLTCVRSACTTSNANKKVVTACFFTFTIQYQTRFYHRIVLPPVPLSEDNSVYFLPKIKTNDMTANAMKISVAKATSRD